MIQDYQRGQNYLAGQGSFEIKDPTHIHFKQTTKQAAFNHNRFDIAAGNQATHDVPDTNSTTVHRVTGKNQDPSKIYGTITSPGNVFILDRNGVFVGDGAVINTNSIVISSGDISNEDLMSGNSKLLIENFGEGSVINEGTITAADAGLVALVGKHVSNRGTINANMGRVALASGGEKVTVDLYGDNLVEIALDDAKGRALVENSGTINAQGGTVELTARAAKDVVDEVINMDGVIQASSFTQKGGKIILSGGNSGTVKVSGTAKASGKTGGGTVEVTGAKVEVTETANVSADALVDGDGGSIYFIGRDMAILNGRASARGGENSGNGGFVELSSDEDFSITGVVDTTAANGTTGTFLIDPRDIELRLGTRTSIFDSNLYESDIEALSLLTDIDLEARRNFSVHQDIFGAGSDGVVTLANNRNLTIQTDNDPYNLSITIPFFGTITLIDEPNNAGSIDLTGNTIYGSDLEFRTAGTGTISILGATANDQSSDIVLSKLTTGGGDITINTNNGRINWKGDVNSNGGNISGTSTKRQRVEADINSDGGDITLASTARLDVRSNGSLISNGGNIGLNVSTNDFIYVDGLIDSTGATNGDVTLDSGSNVVMRNSSEIKAGLLTTNSGNLVQQDSGSTITADKLEGNVDKTATFAGLTNQIDAIGDFLTGLSPFNDGGFTLHDIDGFSVMGNVSTEGGEISFTTNSNSFDDIIEIASTGSLTSQGGDINVDNNGGSGGFITVLGDVDAGTGDVLLNGRQNKLNGTSTITADMLTLNGGLAIQQAGSTIIADSLTGSLSATASLLGANNQINTLKSFATGTAGFSTGGFTFHEVDGYDVTGNISTTGGDISLTTNSNSFDDIIDIKSTGAFLSEGGDINVDNNGGSGGFITVLGDIDAGTGDVLLNGRQNKLNGTSTITADMLTLNGGLAIQQAGSTIIADSLTGSLSATASLLGANNQINTLKDFATGTAAFSDGGFAFHETDGYDVIGAVSTTGGDIALTTNANSFDDIIDINSTGALISNGGDINIDNNGASGGFVISTGNIDARGVSDGNVAINARQLKLNGTSTVFADMLTTTGGRVDQQAGSTITANGLTGSLTSVANFLGTNNSVLTIKDFDTGTAAFSDGGFVFNNGGGNLLDIIGSVTTTGGDVNIFNNGSIWSEGTRLAGSILSQGGAVTLGNNKGNVIVSNSGVLNADMGDVNFASNGSDIQLQGNAAVTGGNVDFQGGQVTQSSNSVLTAKKLTGSVQKFAHFDGTNNAIEAVGDFAVGTVAWYPDTNGLRIRDTGGIDLMGNVTSTGGSIDVYSNGAVWSEATKVSGSVISQGGATTMANEKGNLIVTNSGDVDAVMGDVNFLSNGSDIQLQGNAQVTGGDVDFQGGQVTQSFGSTLTAKYLTGTVQKFAEFLGLKNEVEEVGDFAVGTVGWYPDTEGFTLIDNNGILLSGDITSTGGPITVFSNGDVRSERTVVTGDISSQGGDITLLNNQGNIVLRNNSSVDSGSGASTLATFGRVRLRGNSELTGNTVNLAGDSIVQSSNSVIKAGTLNGITAKFAYLDGTGNKIRRIGTFLAGLLPSYNDNNGIRVVNDRNLRITGPVATTGGDIGINNDGNFRIANGGSIDADGGNIDIFQTGTFRSNNQNTVRTSGAGTIDLVQNNGGSINSAVGSIENTGTGLNTVVANAGFYNETVNVTDDNFLLIGANAGVSPSDPARGPETTIGVIGSGMVISGTNVDVDGFNFDGSLNGVEVNGGDNVNLVNNIFSNNISGLSVTGPTNGNVAFSNNLFTDNIIGASFQSGNINLTGDTNSFIGGVVGLQFSPFVPGTDLSLVDNTIGTSFFSGQSSFFVQLANGAFFAPGSPTILNGLDATYDSPFGLINPRTSLPLTADELNFLEARFFHNTDDGTLGLFFYGQPDLNEEDFLKIFSEFDAPNGALNLTILGMPFVSQSQALANLSPAAGTGSTGTSASELANLAPAAGGDGSADEFANLEPATGGEDVSCWSDAMAGVSSGTSVSFNFGGGFEDAVNGAASCSSGTF